MTFSLVSLCGVFPVSFDIEVAIFSGDDGGSSSGDDDVKSGWGDDDGEIDGLDLEPNQAGRQHERQELLGGGSGESGEDRDASESGDVD